MDREQVLSIRTKLGKTQKQLGDLLGVSLKAVTSYEQGWRKVPTHVERQMYYLVSRTKENRKRRKPCWVIKDCPPARKKTCPAWEFRSGTVCWFINGTICGGVVYKNWKEKMEICRSCDVLTSLL